jgi:UDP-N-acetylmuramoylalanine--D-glutamate ligase
MIDKLKEEFKDKKILILGFGKEGRDTFKFLRKLFPNKILGIADKSELKDIKKEKFSNVKWHLGKNYLNSLKDYDIIIKSPGIPIHLPEIEKAFKKGKITSQIEIFFNYYQNKIIGITGTKGKSTTTSLIYQILKEAKIKTKLAGNIGKPVLNLLFSKSKNEFCVIELSCHQLYNLKKSPYIAIFLNFYPEHLDYYKNLREYFLAKSNIAKYQTENDYFIFQDKQKEIKNLAKKLKSKKIPISLCKIKKRAMFYKNEKIINLKDIPLVGKYNLDNLKAAILTAKILNIKTAIIKRAIKKFKPLPHRLELVGEFKKIKFYNDSIATIPEATILAINSLKGIDTLILGGYDRNIDFYNLAKEILRKRIRNLILFPDTGNKIYEEILKIKPKPKINFYFLNSMEKAVKLAYKITKKRKICLLSPASASFNLFKDYRERGNLFKKYVKLYARKL